MIDNHATLPREMSADVCPTCAALRERAEYVQRFDYRDGQEAWAEYERHRRECHHVLHVATAKGAK